MLPGQLIDSSAFAGENEQIKAEGGKIAEGAPVLLGVTNASLATESECYPVPRVHPRINADPSFTRESLPGF